MKASIPATFASTQDRHLADRDGVRRCTISSHRSRRSVARIFACACRRQCAAYSRKTNLSQIRPKLNREAGRLNWNENAEASREKFALYNPWPGAFTELGGGRFKNLCRVDCRSSRKPGARYCGKIGNCCCDVRSRFIADRCSVGRKAAA